MRHVVNATPVALGGALVVPAGLLRRLRGEEPAEYGCRCIFRRPRRPRRIEKTRHGRRSPRRGGSRLPRRGCLRREMRLGYDLLPARRGRQSSPKPATSRSKAA